MRPPTGLTERNRSSGSSSRRRAAPQLWSSLSSSKEGDKQKLGLHLVKQRSLTNMVSSSFQRMPSIGRKKSSRKRRDDNAVVVRGDATREEVESRDDLGDARRECGGGERVSPTTDTTTLFTLDYDGCYDDEDCIALRNRVDVDRDRSLHSLALDPFEKDFIHRTVAKLRSHGYYHRGKTGFIAADLGKLLRDICTWEKPFEFMLQRLYYEDDDEYDKQLQHHRSSSRRGVVAIDPLWNGLDHSLSRMREVGAEGDAKAPSVRQMKRVILSVLRDMNVRAIEDGGGKVTANVGDRGSRRGRVGVTASSARKKESYNEWGNPPFANLWNFGFDSCHCSLYP